MRRIYFFSFAVVLLLWAAPAQAVIALGAETAAVQAETGTTCTTGALTASVGDLITVTIGARLTETTTISSVSGSLNGAYTQAVSHGGNRVRIYYFANSAGGSETVTVTMTGTITIGVICGAQRWTGAATVAPADQTNTASNSATSHPHGSITEADGLILTVAAESATNTETVATDFTALSDGGFRYWAQYRIVSSSITTDGAFTSSVGINTECAIVGFNAAAGGGSIGCRNLLLLGVGGTCS